MQREEDSRGIRQYLRTRTRHENDVLPIIYWFLTAHAAGLVAHKVSAAAMRWYGIQGTTTMKIVGGGHVSYETVPLAAYYAMGPQLAVFFAVAAAFWFRDRGWNRD